MVYGLGKVRIMACRDGQSASIRRAVPVGMAPCLYYRKMSRVTPAANASSDRSNGMQGAILSRREWS